MGKRGQATAKDFTLDPEPVGVRFVLVAVVVKLSCPKGIHLLTGCFPWFGKTSPFMSRSSGQSQATRRCVCVCVPFAILELDWTTNLPF